MGTEFLVASLWGVVLVYWFWSRRPSTADTVGLFRRELRVLEDATPTWVAPANRRCAEDLPALPTSLVAAAASHKRTEVRRRRKDVLSVLAAAVILSLAVAVATRSGIALGSQAASDVAFLSYVCLLARATRARAGAVRAPTRAAADFLVTRVPARVYGPAKQPMAAASMPTAAAVSMPAMASAAPSRPATGPATRSYEPVHALSSAVRRAAMGDGDERYGDFDSYASLALANAR